MQKTLRIDVAVAVVFNSAGHVLWACRPEGKPYAGYWEFPGGKVEPHETVWQALVRELKEELGIAVLQGGPWFCIDHNYEHAQVCLHLYRVWNFEGDPQPLEQQSLMWADLNQVDLRPILPATAPLLSQLSQPSLMVLSNYEFGFQACASRLERGLLNLETQAYVQFREKSLRKNELLGAFEHCKQLCQTTGNILLLNSDTWLNLQNELDELPCPLHLTQAHLLSGFFSDLQCLGASVHNQETLELAFSRGLDYAVLGAVKETASHPGSPALGWGPFLEITRTAKLPVFAIGGLSQSDLRQAQLHGAHGVALLSQFEPRTQRL